MKLKIMQVSGHVSTRFIIDSDGPICRTASPCSIRGRIRPLMLYPEEKEKVDMNILPDELFDA